MSELSRSSCLGPSPQISGHFKTINKKCLLQSKEAHDKLKDIIVSKPNVQD